MTVTSRRARTSRLQVTTRNKELAEAETQNKVNTCDTFVSNGKVGLEMWHKRTSFHEDLLTAGQNSVIINSAAFHKTVIHVPQRPRDDHVLMAELLGV